MTLKELKKICAQGETQFVEFKQYATKASQIIEEVSGFLNSTGGRLFIGVKDDGTITGLKFVEDDLDFVKEALRKYIAPAFDLVSETIQVSRTRAVILLQIPEGEDKPYRAYDANDGSSKIFYRVDDECIKASRELRGVLKQADRQRGQTLIYSDIEATILKEIDKFGKLSKLDIQEKTAFTSRKVSDCLIRLVTSKVLTIIPSNSGDLFEYNHSG